MLLILRSRGTSHIRQKEGYNMSKEHAPEKEKEKDYTTSMSWSFNGTHVQDYEWGKKNL